MTRFYLIRHATNDTVGRLLAGRGDVQLNREGVQQADELALRLSVFPIHQIFSSPLSRAVQTASPLAQRLGLTVQIEPAFNEIDFGRWTGCSFEELSSDPLFRQFNALRSCTRIPGGELMGEAQGRMVSALERIRKEHGGMQIAVFSHADMIRATLAWYAGLPIDLFHRISISPVSVTVIDLFEEDVLIRTVNHAGDPGASFTC